MLKRRSHSPQSPPVTPSPSETSLPIIKLIPPSEVTQESLEVWRHLPSKIRRDPSWVSFRKEHERLHGALPEEDEEVEKVPEKEDKDSDDHGEFITMKSLSKDEQEPNTVDPFSFSDTEEHEPKPNSKPLDPRVSFTRPQKMRKYVKIGFFCLSWFVCVVAFLSRTEKNLPRRQVVIPPGEMKYYMISEIPGDEKFTIILRGGFLREKYKKNISQNFVTVEFETVTVRTVNETSIVEGSEKMLSPWRVITAEPELYERTPRIERKTTFFLSSAERHAIHTEDKKIRLKMSNSKNVPFAFQVSFDPTPVNFQVGAICAAALLILLYGLIIFEVVHRTFAAIITATLSIAMQSLLGDRPTMEEIMIWMDIETNLLLFSMMILVAFLTETGVFDYLAVKVFETTGGKIWPLIHCLCVITCLISAVLDNVTTVLLMTPITIRLCEVLDINPIPVLMGIIVQSNIGGTLTPIGDPPSLVIYNNNYILNSGITFFTFIEHMAPGVVLCVIQSCLHLRIAFRDMHSLRLKEPKELKELRREITVWQRTADSLNSYSKNIDVVRETILLKVQQLKEKLAEIEETGIVSVDSYKHTLEELKAAYPVKNRNLLAMATFVLLFIITLFFVQSIPGLKTLPLGWVALLGIMLLIIISDRDDMDVMMHRIEWTTLLFFAALFVTMESVQRLGLIHWVVGQTENAIMWVSEEHRLAMAIFIFLWVSALLSAFVETLPITSVMLNTVVSLAERQKLGLPLRPLVWALAFGPCLGGNGTLYGNSANVVCAGIAEQHGYRFSFNDFFKIGFPMMIGSVIVTTAYLMFAHVLFSWNNI